MIDAYEIGIQLLLQDDVSAGLAVINRGLADVDRGIAATSENLTGLVHDAERASKAIAIAAGAQIPNKFAAGPASETAPIESAVKAPIKEGVLQAPNLPAAGNTVAPDIGVNKADVSSRATAVEVEQNTRSGAKPREPWQADASNAPSKAEPNEAGLSHRQHETAVEKTIVVAPGPRVERAPSHVSMSDKMQDRETVLRGQVNQSPSTAPTANIAITGSVGQMVAEAAATPARARTQFQYGTRQPAIREHTAAPPRSSPKRDGSRIETTEQRERAAAPQSPDRERGEAGGGAVMLDGRLMGQWLSEHMAREASRPPSGTSFFDARQTPAWNVSGAL